MAPLILGNPYLQPWRKGQKATMEQSSASCSGLSRLVQAALLCGNAVASLILAIWHRSFWTVFTPFAVEGSWVIVDFFYNFFLFLTNLAY